LLLPLTLLGLILAASSAYGWWNEGRFVESTDDAYLQADKVTVSTRIAGFVDQVYVADNQFVHAAEPLAKIDDRGLQAKLDQANAQADQGQAAIVQASAQMQQQEALIAQRRAQLDSANSQKSFADTQEARYGALAATGAETGERYDQMRQNRDQAGLQVRQAEADLLAAQRSLSTCQGQLQLARAQFEQARALARQIRVDIESTTLRASVDGRIGDKTVQVGQFVQPGTNMMTVVPVQDLYLVANFKETQVGNMRIGQAATISVDAFGGRKLHGVVESFAPGTGAQFALIPPNNATGNFTKIVQRVPVRIRLTDRPRLEMPLVPGLSVTASIDTKAAASRSGGKVADGTDPEPESALDAPDDADSPAGGTTGDSALAARAVFSRTMLAPAHAAALLLR
jgi:membrane fusion protein (multidrug efflux system)